MRALLGQIGDVQKLAHQHLGQAQSLPTLEGITTRTGEVRLDLKPPPLKAPRQTFENFLGAQRRAAGYHTRPRCRAP